MADPYSGSRCPSSKSTLMSNAEAMVYVVDDDVAVRDSLRLLLKSVGVACETFESAAEFLDAFGGGGRACLVADIRMPGMSGLELQAELNRRQIRLPLIFITGHGDVPMAVDAMKRGAVEFIQKPFREQELLDCIHAALLNSKQEHDRRDERKKIMARLKTLTARENEVLEWTVDGHPNKLIAIELGISQRTVENHRANILEKMKVRSTPALIKLIVSARTQA